MLCLLPLLAAGTPMRVCGVPVPWGQKARTWAALMGAGMVAGLFPYNAIPAFAVIDFAAGVIVLKRPQGEAQRAIGLLFIGMLFVHVGFFLACWLQPGAKDWTSYAEFNRLLGWLQFACLASWGAADAVGGIVRSAWGGGDQIHARNGRQ